MRRLTLGIAMGWICAAEAAGQASPFCPAYTASPIYRPRLRQVPANPSNWIGLIEGALDGDEILLADGVYNLNQYAVQITKQITVRGASGNRAAVRVQGQGYGVGGEGFMIHAQNVTIADLTMTAIRNHAISIKGESGAEAPHVYNVHLYDIGTQHIKGTPGDGVGNGVVACSRIGYTTGGVKGDYINAIDIHRGIGWIVRDNEIYNIWGDGTGCEVDVACGTYLSGGGPRSSSGTTPAAPSSSATGWSNPSWASRWATGLPTRAAPSGTTSSCDRRRAARARGGPSPATWAFTCGEVAAPPSTTTR